MHQLVLIVIAFMLSSALTVVTINYVPLHAVLQQQQAATVEKGLSSVSQGLTNYLKDHMDESGGYVLPASDTVLMGELFPTYSFKPTLVKEATAWQVGVGSVFGMPAVYVCLAGPVGDESLSEVLQRVQRRKPEGSTYVSGACGATANGAGASLTYWLVPTHL